VEKVLKLVALKGGNAAILQLSSGKAKFQRAGVACNNYNRHVFSVGQLK
jgi:hypothetical protein